MRYPEPVRTEKPNRRDILADAAIEVLSGEGARGLTHRAVDLQADVPPGTTSNYFRTRDALFEVLAARIDARLRPDPDALEKSAKARPSVGRMVVLMQELVARILARPSLYLALLELRLEATRRPPLATALTATLARNLEADLAFMEAARLPGGREELVMLQLAIDGVLLDRLTAPDARGIENLDAIVEQITRRLMAR
jgi:DNA-binding transcriptional regulator YbjK